ncbi:MAG: hypothetical protein MJE77_00940 [Proteobacteria bacterium]|nr:hypothetical protein [Pseudomonadota bacterium]
MRSEVLTERSHQAAGYSISWTSQQGLQGVCAILVALVACACGQNAVPPPAAAPTPRVAKSHVLPDRNLNGSWRWSLVTDKDGVRQVEVETWHLHAKRGTITGNYVRKVTFLALDGVPFECNQTLSYEIQTTYRLRGGYRGDQLELEEKSYDTALSPCDKGQRTLAVYRGHVRPDELVLRWPGGQQTLSRLPARTSDQDRDHKPSPAQLESLAGSWRWQSRNEQHGLVRVEVEEWEISETPAGRVAGTILRTVTIFDPRGRRFDCSGDTFYRYRDRYTISGRRAGNAVTLNEIAVTPEKHPCVVRGNRHLDEATGTAANGYLVLMWRGNRRQVLHRASTSP